MDWAVAGADLIPPPANICDCCCKMLRASISTIDGVPVDVGAMTGARVAAAAEGISGAVVPGVIVRRLAKSK